MPLNLLVTGIILLLALGVGVTGVISMWEPSQASNSPQVAVVKHVVNQTFNDSPLRLSEAKQRFVKVLLPLIESENRKIFTLRTRLLRMQKQHYISIQEQYFLAQLVEDYRVSSQGLGDRELITSLLLKVDVLPVDLVLAQAAMETAWGTSRFATQANNYFGQWCFQRGCGLVPNQRANNKIHEVRRFASPAESVQAYMKNINSHPAYRELRKMRFQHKQRGSMVRGEKLAEGLIRYLQMGEGYVVAIRSIIKSNRLHHFAQAY